METCKVCWNCRGLFVGEKCTDLAIQYHLKSCKDCAPYYINKESEPSTFDFYVCDRSDYKAFAALKRTLSKHESLAENKYKCSECNYVARNMATLKEHTRKHTGEMITCPHEGCSFASLYERSLTKHLKQKHAEDKCHVCCVCGFQTRHTASLAKHMMLHRDYKPYKCAQCSFTALFPSEIISHAKSRHLKQKQYSCPKCPFKTSYALAIRKHIARHDGVKGYACSICGEALESMLKAKKHMVNDHGCNDYQIIQEQSLEKVKPSDYKIANLKKDRIENAYVTLNSLIINEKLDKKPDAESTSHEMVSELLDVPLPSESITDTISSKALSPERNIYTNSVPSSKGGNPMLCATTTNLNDNDNSMIEDSLFDLMSDFPRPPTLNRCQSASTLMFASFSPHLVDRPLTPDFFTDSPSVGSFFTNYTSKNLESEALTLGTFESNAHSMSVPQSNSILISLRAVNPPSPILPSFVSSPGVGSLTSMSNVTLAQLPVQESVCMDLDTILPSTVLSKPPKQKTSRTQCDKKISRIPFATSKSAFTSISTDFSPEIQAAVASIPLPEDSTQNISLTEESPFPSQI
ncbi:telomere zinc finger-associated protein-like isoform X2 [Physella acuta]|uniref:telomere zinc finger-associated protein-like isoform X2 n=1 Tax=Physella acuta TaxID=109671 RepID=UPI0027DB2A81|nr:telomere zinc finger-associated protein-like isoform X2 [Physella acuta]